jgi:hypothetical protein
VQQLSLYASRVTLSLRHAALESLPQGHDQAASSAAAARHACLRAGGVARRGVLLLSFVNESISDAHAALESIAARKMHWMPFGMQQAIGAGVHKSSPRFAWGRGSICMCFPVRQRCFDTCTRGAMTETTGGSALCTGSFSRRPLLGYRLAFQDQMERSFLLDVAVQNLTCGRYASASGGIT